MIRNVLVANRGEIARRVFRTARAMGMGTVAVYADPDADAPFVREADGAVRLPGTAATDTYLNIDRIIEAARSTGADAIHPGYGFLAEHAGFARAVVDAGVRWVGPPPECIALMGNKVEAKQRMSGVGIPTLPSERIRSDHPDEWAAAAQRIGFPLLVKAEGGGGGKGMLLIPGAPALVDGIERASREAGASFGDSRVFLERYLASPRHVEIQVFGDRRGTVMHLGARDCSIQRRHQKIVEESPPVDLAPGMVDRMAAAAVDGAEAIGYVGAGTFEFLVDGDDFYFLEMNTRLQVEHTVTEEVTGIDLVRLQLLVASGAPLPVSQRAISTRGHAIEARLYAEDPRHDWAPRTGTVVRWAPGPTPVRWDVGVDHGSVVTTRFDPMLGKVIAHAETRGEAAARLARALRELAVHGVTTNRDFLVAVLEDAEFLSGAVTTAFLNDRPDLVAHDVDATARMQHCAIATVAAAARRRRRAKAVPFLPAGWRNVPSMDQRQIWEDQGAEISVAYQFDGRAFTVRIGDEEVAGSVLIASDDVVDAEIGDERVRASITWDGERVWVQTSRGQTVWKAVGRFVEHGPKESGGGLVAPLPGTVVMVLVDAGQTVSAGDRLVVIESMKMEHAVCAPSDGVVTAVLVKAGDSVEAHEVLITLTPDQE